MAAAVDITTFLQSTQSLNAEQRGNAEQQLRQFEEQQFAVYLVSLASEVANNGKPPETRQIAGVVLKNALSAVTAEKRVGGADGEYACSAAWLTPADATLLGTGEAHYKLEQCSACSKAADQAAIAGYPFH